jgi:apolipoprotein N-acyltransferase
MSDFSFGGKKQQPLIANGLVIAPSICYEIIFSNELLHFLPQANLLLLVTDDSWFGESIALNQHLQMGQMRALETGRYLLFVANSGITAIINAQGQVQQTIPAFQTAILHGTVQPMQGRTPYVLWHNTPIYILCVLLLLLAIRRRKK